MADPAPQQPFQNVRQRGVADNRRTRPTTAERFITETKRGSENYRGINPETKQRKNPLTRKVLEQEAALGTRLPQGARAVFGPVMQPQLAANIHRDTKTLKKRVRIIRTSWAIMASFWLFYLLSLVAVLISFIGAGLSIYGEEAVNWVPFVGRWLAGYAGNPGEYVFAAGYVVALVIQVLLLGITFAAYAASRVFWWKYWPCWIFAIFAIVCAVGPFIQLIPATFFFMIAVLYFVK